MRPDMDTLGYWVERFRPLMEASGSADEVVVVLANRTGEEGDAERIGEVRYAGSSTVLGMRKGDGNGEVNVKIWDVLGRAQDGILIVDTERPARYGVKRQMAPELEEASMDELEERDVMETTIGAS